MVLDYRGRSKDEDKHLGITSNLGGKILKGNQTATRAICYISYMELKKENTKRHLGKHEY